MTIEINNTDVKMFKAIYLAMSILDISKMLMYEFWHDYIKLKYDYNSKLCYIDNSNKSFVIHIKIRGFYEKIENDVKEWFDS